MNALPAVELLANNTEPATVKNSGVARSGAVEKVRCGGGGEVLRNF